jgi:hypothetical protein
VVFEDPGTLRLRTLLHLLPRSLRLPSVRRTRRRPRVDPPRAHTLLRCRLLLALLALLALLVPPHPPA